MPGTQSQNLQNHTETTTVSTSGGTTTTTPTSSTTDENGDRTSSGTSTTTTPGKTTTTVSTDPYKTQFVKVYQDAGVIGAAMLTLLVICALLAVLCFRVIKMYNNLITARDQLDAARVTVIEKLTENIIGIRVESLANSARLEAIRGEILWNREESSRSRDAVLAESRRVCDRLERLAEKPPRARGQRRGS